MIAALSAGDEHRFCVRCRAGLRYWMLARYVRENPAKPGGTVVELDDRSPLQPVLDRPETNYIRTFWLPDVPAGTTQADGARCEDITNLTFADDSVDVMISSEVLEHVPDLDAAMRETERVLKPGGYHVFTVPPRSRTRRRAVLRDGVVQHLIEPEYHSDPIARSGILAYWDVGIEDAAEIFQRPNLRLTIVDGPTGRDGRVLWCASKPASGAS